MLKRLPALALAALVVIGPHSSFAQSAVEARKGWDETIKELEQLSMSTDITPGLKRLFSPDVLFVEVSGRVSSNREWVIFREFWARQNPKTNERVIAQPPARPTCAQHRSTRASRCRAPG